MEPDISHHRSWILVDGHVHIYRHFSTSACLDWALKNFGKTAESLTLSGNIDHVLFLAESSGNDWFAGQQLLARTEPQARLGVYQRVATMENNSIVFSGPSAKNLVVLAGRQIVSLEGIEVLALGLNEPFPDRIPLQKVLSDMEMRACITVLPWGVGKWLGRRRHVIASLLAQERKPGLFLADSGNRPCFWPLPKFFQPPGPYAPCTLSGSDPLPLANQEKRIGTCGFLLKGPLDLLRPYGSLKEKIEGQTCPIQTFGKSAGLFSFFSDQLAMQFKKLAQ